MENCFFVFYFFDSRNSNLSWSDNFVFKPLPRITGISIILPESKIVFCVLHLFKLIPKKTTMYHNT